MTEQPVRHTADTINDNALDQLYTELERYRLAWTSARGRAGGARIAWRCWFRLAEKRRIRAEQAEAAIARVRAECDALIQDRDRLSLDPDNESFGDGYADAVARIRLALTGA
ncbi:hypothetical protein OOK31_25435 [Streptomyces sp. NBC_00249]|uniref:hypothetical protein n=1 Tax=Streptomyces sp. NBC_00249 TaxID=2975690 RepID=UPI002251C52F|nr:hypothetical protein [Streptomyces sp. NBC_00249]MCX5197200.1 hypothetical protein [Streptomyces sp. NBC_00249]